LVTAPTIAYFGSGVSATLDGFRLSPGNATGDRVVVSVAGDAAATLAHLQIDAASSSGSYSERAIAIVDGTGGALSLSDSVVHASDASSQSIALDERGAAAVTVARTTLAAGRAPATYGILVEERPSADGRTLTLDTATVSANVSAVAAGVYVRTANSLSITNGSIAGKGSSESSSAPVGVYADSVGQVTIIGATVTGTDAPTVYPVDTTSAMALQLSNSKNIAGAAASVTGATLDGGTSGIVRRGIDSSGVPLTVATSTISATRGPIQISTTEGVRSAIGIELEGTFPAGTVISIHDNVELVGGDVCNPCFDYRCGGAAVRFDSTVDSVIEKNQAIRGVNVVGGFATDGIRINQGGNHAIRNNASIVAGRQTGGDWAFFAGINVTKAGSAIATVTVDGNGLVAGNPTPMLGNDAPIGFYGKGVTATLTNNTRILGGYGWYPYGVLVERAPDAAGAPVPNNITLSGNAIDGGGNFGAGLSLHWQTATVTDNVIQACGLKDASGQPDPVCKAIGTSYGMLVEGASQSLIANNYVFGGFTSEATACTLGCDPQGTGCSLPLSVSFVDNLCAVGWNDFAGATMTATALDLRYWGAPDCPLVAGNILDGSGNASAYDLKHDSSFQNATPTECWKLSNNDLVPRGSSCAAWVYLKGSLCYSTAAALNAASTATQQLSANVDLDPSYVAANLSQPTAAGYHLDATCALGGKGLANASVTTDFDGKARATPPAIGPDECP
jgi:hypothetical protein